MATPKISKMSLFGGIVFTFGGILAVYTGRLRSATILEFGVYGLPARIVGALLIVMGSTLLFDCIARWRKGREHKI